MSLKFWKMYKYIVIEFDNGLMTFDLLVLQLLLNLFDLPGKQLYLVDVFINSDSQNSTAELP